MSRFDRIDRNATFCEQSYAFKQLDNKKFFLQLAVINPELWLPFPPGEMAEDFLKIVDAICERGAKSKIKYSASNKFLENFGRGMRSYYLEAQHKNNGQFDHVVYSTVFDGQKDVLINNSISEFDIQVSVPLDISDHDFFSYGAVYYKDDEYDIDSEEFNLFKLQEHEEQSRKRSKEEENITGARNLETLGRNNKELLENYHMVLDDGEIDTLGSFVVCVAGYIVKKAASLFNQNNKANPLHFIRSKGHRTGFFVGTNNQVDKKKVEHHRYQFLKNANSGAKKIFPVNLSTPLSTPADLFNVLQSAFYARSKKNGKVPRPMMSGGEISKLLIGLQKRNDEGERLTAEIVAKKAAKEITSPANHKPLDRMKLVEDPHCPEWKIKLNNAAFQFNI